MKNYFLSFWIPVGDPTIRALNTLSKTFSIFSFIHRFYLYSSLSIRHKINYIVIMRAERYYLGMF